VPAQRPSVIELHPELLMALMNGEGRVVAEGRGRIEVERRHPEELYLAVLIPARDDAGGGTLVLRFEISEGYDGPPGWEALGPRPGAE
jgi:hypothetical protein